MMGRAWTWNDKVPEGCPLSNAEFETLTLLSAGRTYKQIAEARGCCHSTVRSLTHRAYQRLGVKGGMAPAITKMKDSGWLGAPPRAPRERQVTPEKVTPVQLAYNACFVTLCRERTPRAAAIVTVAFGLLAAVHRLPSRPREPPDIDALLLRMAHGVRRPIPQ